ncbi:RNA methyltransferase [Halosegnis marinus]|uniref:RNA methyltransferase n=1 Tax=Halosegnis marinus TaxID=3034023 RepID=A0ABD5ZLZ3_9EURY|nr:RNA methyltransferase [Halosegnis sp. DT85]
MTRTVLVPSSLTREAEDKREATRKLGYVARAAVVFRVDRLVVFPDGEGDTGRFGDGFVDTVLRYAATPPYLRKEAWGRRDELEYVGVLPPLRVASRTGSGSDDSGSLRQGIVTEVGADDRVRVNCGLQHPVSLPVPPAMRVPAEGERVTVRVTSREPVRARLTDDTPPGYQVTREDLATALAREDAGVRIAASRYGEPLTVDRLDSLVERVHAGVTVVFGSPERGLPEILGVEPGEATVPSDAAASAGTRDDADDFEPRAGFDLWLNTVPNQGSEVVRTEEAMFATLAALTLE